MPPSVGSLPFGCDTSTLRRRMKAVNALPAAVAPAWSGGSTVLRRRRRGASRRRLPLPRLPHGRPGGGRGSRGGDVRAGIPQLAPLRPAPRRAPHLALPDRALRRRRLVPGRGAAAAARGELQCATRRCSRSPSSPRACRRSSTSAAAADTGGARGGGAARAARARRPERGARSRNQLNGVFDPAQPGFEATRGGDVRCPQLTGAKWTGTRPSSPSCGQVPQSRRSACGSACSKARRRTRAPRSRKRRLRARRRAGRGRARRRRRARARLRQLGLAPDCGEAAAHARGRANRRVSSPQADEEAWPARAAPRRRRPPTANVPKADAVVFAGVQPGPERRGRQRPAGARRRVIRSELAGALDPEEPARARRRLAPGRREGQGSLGQDEQGVADRRLARRLRADRALPALPQRATAMPCLELHVPVQNAEKAIAKLGGLGHARSRSRSRPRTCRRR